MEDVSYEKFEKKCECANASKFWEFRDGTVVIIELPKRDHEVAHCALTKQFTRQDPQDAIDYAGSASTVYILYI